MPRTWPYLVVIFVDSGPCISLPFLVDLPLQFILQIFTGLNPYFNIHVDMQEYTKVNTSC